MSDINNCMFTGRLGADPEVKSFQNGGRIANLRLAVGSSWKDKNTGEKKERTEWVSVSIQNEGLVGVAERFLKKSSRIAVIGEFRTRKWQDQSGNDRYTTEIVLSPFNGTLTMLDGPQQDDRRRSADNDRQDARHRSHGSGSGGGWGQGATNSGGGSGGGWQDDLDDDIPFVTSDCIW